jgi:hypothetical protein
MKERIMKGPVHDAGTQLALRSGVQSSQISSSLAGTRHNFISKGNQMKFNVKTQMIAYHHEKSETDLRIKSMTRKSPAKKA